MSNRARQDGVVFQDEATADGNGLEYLVLPDVVTISLQTISTSSDALISFEGSLDGENWFPINALNLNSFDLVTSILSNLAETDLYQLDATGVKYVRCRISNITSGTVTILGRMVD